MYEKWNFVGYNLKLKYSIIIKYALNNKVMKFMRQFRLRQIEYIYIYSSFPHGYNLITQHKNFNDETV